MDLELFFRRIPPELRLHIYNIALAPAIEQPFVFFVEGVTWLAQSRRLFEEAAPLLYGAKQYHFEIELGESHYEFARLEAFRRHHISEYGSASPYTTFLAVRMIRQVQYQINVAYSHALAYRGLDMPLVAFEKWFDNCCIGLSALQALRRMTLVFCVNSFGPSWVSGGRAGNETLTNFRLSIDDDQEGEYLKSQTDWEKNLNHVAKRLSLTIPKDTVLVCEDESSGTPSPFARAQEAFGVILRGYDAVYRGNTGTVV